MGRHDILTRNIAWKTTSFLLALLTWKTIDTIQTGNNPDRYQTQTLSVQEVVDSAFDPESLKKSSSTNHVSIIRAYDIRILKSPDDTTQYKVEPAQVTVSLESESHPLPDLTDPSAVKVVIDPINIPLDIVETNVSLIVYKPENTTLKNFSPKKVKVTRVIEVSTTPPEDPEPTEEETDKTEAEDSGE
jgi:hypothetical protein